MPNQDQPLVYFFGKSNFGDDQTDFIKIGHTRNDLSIRQAALQTGNEARIWEMGVIPFDTVDEATRKEKDIKCRFGAFRARGEWFYATPRIIQYIADYAVRHINLSHLDEDSARPLYGEQIKACRESRGMTQADLATRIGCSRGYIAFIERGGGMPGEAIFSALVDLFGEFDCPTREQGSDTEEANG